MIELQLTAAACLFVLVLGLVALLVSVLVSWGAHTAWRNATDERRDADEKLAALQVQRAEWEAEIRGWEGRA